MCDTWPYLVLALLALFALALLLVACCRLARRASSGRDDAPAAAPSGGGGGGLFDCCADACHGCWRSCTNGYARCCDCCAACCDCCFKRETREERQRKREERRAARAERDAAREEKYLAKKQNRRGMTAEEKADDRAARQAKRDAMTPDELAKYEERKAKAKSRRDKWKSRRESYEAKADRDSDDQDSHEGSQAFTEATTLTLSDPGAEDVLQSLPCVARAERAPRARSRSHRSALSALYPSGGTQVRAPAHHASSRQRWRGQQRRLAPQGHGPGPIPAQGGFEGDGYVRRLLGQAEIVTEGLRNARASGHPLHDFASHARAGALERSFLERCFLEAHVPAAPPGVCRTSPRCDSRHCF